MATTTYVDTATSAEVIGARTTSAGVAATDTTAEELRLINSILTEGYVTTDAFKVQASAGMVVTVGSGVAKADIYAVAGDIAGQGNYVVRLEGATQNVTVPAADASLARTDEIYLVVADAAYDAGSVSLPRIGYRTGTAGGGAPGPDTAWKASVKLATIAVGAAVTSINAGNITDNWGASTLSPPQAASHVLGHDEDATGTLWPGGGSYINTGAWVDTDVAATFTAPTNGAVVLRISAITDIANGNSDLAARLGYHITGPTAIAADDTRAVKFEVNMITTTFTDAKRPTVVWSFFVTGLTPGGSYTATLAAKGTGGWSIGSRQLIVEAA